LEREKKTKKKPVNLLLDIDKREDSCNEMNPGIDSIKDHTLIKRVTSSTCHLFTLESSSCETPEHPPYTPPHTTTDRQVGKPLLQTAAGWIEGKC
jgi:hypothetical protein